MDHPRITIDRPIPGLKAAMFLISDRLVRDTGVTRRRCVYEFPDRETMESVLKFADMKGMKIGGVI